MRPLNHRIPPQATPAPPAGGGADLEQDEPHAAVATHRSEAGSTRRQRAWLSTADVCEWLGISRETLRQLRLRGVLQPGRHFRRWGCTQGKGPLQWHLESVEATITGWSRRHLRQ